VPTPLLPWPRVDSETCYRLPGTEQPTAARQSCEQMLSRFTGWYSTKATMTGFGKFSELLILMQAATSVCVVRLALWWIPFRNLRRMVNSLTKTRSRGAHRFSVDQLSWAVRVTSRYVPRATCLTQALALHILIKRAGFDSRIRIGVAKRGRHLEAHAWVESQDRIVIGDYESERYMPLMVWD
jgi:Transglutaminase-like superfamily